MGVGVPVAPRGAGRAIRTATGGLLTGIRGHDQLGGPGGRHEGFKPGLVRGAGQTLSVEERLACCSIAR